MLLGTKYQGWLDIQYLILKRKNIVGQHNETIFQCNEIVLHRTFLLDIVLKYDTVINIFVIV